MFDFTEPAEALEIELSKIQYVEEDVRSPDLLSLITANVKEPPKPLTQKAIDEVIDVQKKLKLETGDGALAMLSKSLFS